MRVCRKDQSQGPTLWNLLYDGVFDIEVTERSTIIGYADDLALIVSTNDEYTLMTNVNKNLDRIVDWMRAHKLHLALQKTEAIILKGRRK